MNELSQEALYTLIYNALSFTDTLFQVWLTVTFAAILAIYFSRAEITSWMRWLLILLYCGSSVVLTGRWMIGIGHVVTYQQVLEEAGYARFPTPVGFGTAMAAIHLLMFVVGTIATLYFMYAFSREKRVM